MNIRGFLKLLALGAALLAVQSIFSGCLVTRTETDYFTLTDRDTLRHEIVRNDPRSEGRNGVLFPSSRTIEMEQIALSHDSVYDRRYPDFVRLGGIEFAGLIGTSSSAGIGPGLLGVYSLFAQDTAYGILSNIRDSLKSKRLPNALFKGLLLRVLPYEHRLRWFNDAPDWTIGTSAYEMLAPDERVSERLQSLAFMNGYIRKRFFIRDKVPYIIATPYFGASILPSAYINLGGELQVGSYGGFNLRGYAGYASGFNWYNKSHIIGFPYLGLGVSALDFTNRAIETEREWKDMTNSAIEVEVLDVGLLHSFSSFTSAIDTTTSTFPVTGFHLEFAKANFPLPIFDHHFWVGTTLFDWIALGFLQQGVGVLPVRAGYRNYLIAEDLTYEPFAEFAYYPSKFVNTGIKLRLDTFLGFTISGTVGYTSGNSGDFIANLIYPLGGNRPATFSTGYAELAIGITDRLFTPEKVAYDQAHQP